MLDAFSPVPVGSALCTEGMTRKGREMPRNARRDMPGSALQAVHLYLSNRHAEAEARQAKGDKNRGPYRTIAAYCRAHGTQDDKGSCTWLFPEPVIIGGKKYTGIRLQASQPASYFNEEEAQDLIDSLGPEVAAEATRTEIIYDLDYLFVLLQQQRITSADLDKVLIKPGREYSLTVLQGD